MWDVETGSVVFRLGGSGFVSASYLAFSPDGRYLAASDDYFVVWCAQTGRHLWSGQDLAPERDRPVFTPDGFVLVPLWDGSSLLCDAATGKPACRFTERGSPRAFLDDGRLLLAQRDRLALWEVASGRLVALLEAGARTIHITVRGPMAALANGDGTVSVWDLRALRQTAIWEAHQRWATAVAILEDGSLVSGGGDGRIRRWKPDGTPFHPEEDPPQPPDAGPTSPEPSSTHRATDALRAAVEATGARRGLLFAPQLEGEFELQAQVGQVGDLGDVNRPALRQVWDTALPLLSNSAQTMNFGGDVVIRSLSSAMIVPLAGRILYLDRCIKDGLYTEADLERLLQTVQSYEQEWAAGLAPVERLQAARVMHCAAALVAWLEDGDQALQVAAAERLGALGSRAADAVPALATLVLVPGSPARLPALRSLERLGPVAQAAAEDLAVCLGDVCPEIRAEAARALGGLGVLPPSALEALVRSFEDAVEAVRLQAVHALARLGNAPALCRLLHRENDLGEAAREALVGMGAAAVPALAEVLTNPLEARCSKVLEVLARLGADAAAALPVVERLLASGQAIPAAQCLGAMGPAAASATPALLAGVGGAPEEGSAAVLTALARIGPTEEVVARLLAWIPGAPEDPAADLLEVLGGRGAPAVPVLLEALRDPRPAIRRSAIAALVRAAAGPEFQSALAEVSALLQDPDPSVREAAAGALGSVPVAAGFAVPKLLEALGEPGRRQPGWEAIKQGLDAILSVDMPACPPDYYLHPGPRASGREGAGQQRGILLGMQPAARLEGCDDGARRSLGLTPDGRYLVLAGGPGSGRARLRLWDLTRRCLAGMVGDYTSHRRFQALTVTGEGRLVVTLSWAPNERPRLHVWEIPGGGCVHTFEVGHACDVACQADGGRAILASSRALQAWDLSAGKLRGLLQGHRGNVQQVALSWDGRVALSIDQGTAWVWNVRRGNGRMLAIGVLPECVALSADGRTAVVGGCPVEVWDVAHGRRRHTLHAHARHLALTPDGCYAATLGDDLMLWDVEEGRLLAQQAAPADTWGGVAVSSDLRVVASSSPEASAIWMVDWEVAPRDPFLVDAGGEAQDASGRRKPCGPGRAFRS